MKTHMAEEIFMEDEFFPVATGKNDNNDRYFRSSYLFFSSVQRNGTMNQNRDFCIFPSSLTGFLINPNEIIAWKSFLDIKNPNPKIPTAPLYSPSIMV
ncbi:hypothetical protein O6P43_026857 [Quillaja saponaria]|uniref:Uncharacterized protein n=1 Tax=Quillaja saponaria TaxID=32244 RepID=A0AAD7PDE4_QUISA|nr:hypothetical protein O6P43_026857 [Quillaja saponaria]